MPASRAAAKAASRSGPIRPPVRASARMWHLPQLWAMNARGRCRGPVSPRAAAREQRSRGCRSSSGAWRGRGARARILSVGAAVRHEPMNVAPISTKALRPRDRGGTGHTDGSTRRDVAGGAHAGSRRTRCGTRRGRCRRRASARPSCSTTSARDRGSSASGTCSSRSASGEDPDEECVSDHMSGSVITAAPDWSLERAASEMAQRRRSATW